MKTSRDIINEIKEYLEDNCIAEEIRDGIIDKLQDSLSELQQDNIYRIGEFTKEIEKAMHKPIQKIKKELDYER